MENENVERCLRNFNQSYMKDFGGYETHNIVADTIRKLEIALLIIENEKPSVKR